MVWRLQVNLQTRIGLAVILSLGLFASAVAIYKTPLQYRFFEEKDFSGNGAWYYIWYVCRYQVIEDMSIMGEEWLMNVTGNKSKCTSAFSPRAYPP
jgi:hypothetical protein